MNKFSYAAAAAAAAAGALAVAWVAGGHLQGNPLALGMTLLIGAFYVWGVLELWRFQQATRGLQRALAELPVAVSVSAAGSAATASGLDDWLARVPAALRQAVRLRVEDERGVLPGPALTPYLAGLLVLLGMLGTFLGMVMTISGTGLALERATDLQTMRDSLAAPVRGLGLAFGTSVAGVAASAMLGLASALCRRGRAATALALDGHIAGSLQVFTRSHQRRLQQAEQQQLQQAALALQQQQAEQLPLLVASLQALTQSVSLNLQHSVAEGARLAAATLATLQPAVAATLGGISRETTALHGHVTAAVQQQLDGMAQRFEEQATAWLSNAGALAQRQSSALLQSLHDTQARQQAQADERDSARDAARDEARMAAFTNALAQMTARIEQSSGDMHAQVEAQARRTIDEVARLAQAAGEAPRAAAEVVAQLRDKLSASLAQDNAMLEERSRIMATLNTLLGAVQHTSTAQQGAVDELVANSARWLQQAGAQFTAKADAETARLEAVSAQLTASAVDVASLGDAFGGAVQDFGHSSQQMLAHLQQLDDSLARASTRSDEQLAYYVAQAREVIDLSLLSQKQIVDDLQRLARRPDPHAVQIAALGAEA